MKKHMSALIGMLLVSLISVSFGALGQDTPEEAAESPGLNLNIATLEELLELPGITPEMAQMIFDNRPYASFLNALELEEISEEFLVGIEDIAEATLLNINAATVTELQALPGLTTELAEAIIEERPYKIIEQLLKIKGIGEEELQQLQGFIDAQPAETDSDAGDKGWKTRQKNPLLLPGAQP